MFLDTKGEGMVPDPKFYNYREYPWVPPWPLPSMQGDIPLALAPSPPCRGIFSDSWDFPSTVASDIKLIKYYQFNRRKVEVASFPDLTVFFNVTR